MSSYDKPGSLDGAIDEAVREMMQADPRPGLRHRVTASIGARPHRTYGFRLGVAAVALAMMLLASVLVLRSPDPPKPVQAPQVAEAPAARAIPPAGPQAAEAAPLMAMPPPSQSRRRPSPTPESIFGARTDRIVAASVPMTPVEASAAGIPVDSPLMPEGRSAIMPITLAPIHIAPLAIQPLSVSALPIRK